MSVDAIAYVKTLPDDKVGRRGELLLLYIVAENTFNDSGLCKVGQQLLADETRADVRTVRRWIKAFKKAGTIAIHAQPGSGNGRDVDAIELIGFRDWLAVNRAKKKKGQPDKTPADEGEGNRTFSGGATGQQVSGTYKDTRTRTRTSGARKRAKASNSDLEVKGGPPPGCLLITRQGHEWQWWIDHLDKTDRPLADRMRGEFMAYVPQRRPADGMAPCFPAKRAA